MGRQENAYTVLFRQSEKEETRWET